MTQRFGLPALAIVSAALGAGLVTVYRAAPAARDSRLSRG